MKILTIFLLFVSLSSYSQKLIRVSGYDKFLKTYRIETQFTDLASGMLNSTSAGIRSNDTLLFLIHAGVGGKYSFIVSDGAPLMLLLYNDDVVEVRSKAIQGVDVNSYNGTIVRSFKHEYFVDVSTIEMLKKSPVKSVRVYTTDGYYDYEVSQKNAANFMRVANEFLKEYYNKIQ